MPFLLPTFSPILSATGTMLIIVGAISLVILINEAGLFFQSRKGETSAKKSRKSKKTKAQPAAKKAKRTPVEEEDPYAAFGPINSAGVESFTPTSLEEEEANTLRDSEQYHNVREIESMRVRPVDRESVRSGRAISEAWEPAGPVEGIGAVDFERSSLASQLRAAQDSGNYDGLDEESMRIAYSDPSVRIMDTRIDSAAFRRSA